MVNIKDNFFKAPDNNRYFRRNAPAVSVSSYGQKKEPLTEANYLAVEGHPRYEYLDGRIKTDKSVQIDWERENKADVEAHVDHYFDVGGVKLNFNYNKAKSANLKLIRLSIDEGPLKKMLNNEAKVVRDAMKKEGKDARICSSTWIVVSGQLGERFDTKVGLEVSGSTSEGLKITAKGGGSWSGSETITFSPGTVFAYGLHKVKKWNGDLIADMEDDWHGPN